MSNLKHARRTIRDLAKILEFRATFGRPCYLKRNTIHATLIVPQYTDGETGSYAYLRTFQRATIHEACVLGIIRLGPELVTVPPFAGPAGHWSTDPGHKGRTITLAEGVAR